MKYLIPLVSIVFTGCLSEGGLTGLEANTEQAVESASMSLDPLAKQSAQDDIEAASKTSKMLKCGFTEYNVGGKIYRDEEIYSLGVINAKLKYFPAIQKSLQISSIKTCEEARNFITQHNAYYETLESYEKFGEIKALAGTRDATQASAAKSGIYSGIGVINKKGVVSIGYSTGTKNYFCTGYMISSREVVTVGHCLMPLLASGHTGSSNALFIEYFDPKLSAGQRRHLHWLESLKISVASTYAGGLDTQSDIAVITRSVAWDNTTTADYLKMYTGTMAQARYNYFYGRGLNGAADPDRDPPLRYERVYVDWYGEHHYVVLAEGHRLCNGDSGGPFIRDDGTDDVVTGHQSNVEYSSGASGRCSTQGEKERATRLSTKVGWIDGLHRATFGTGCSTGLTADNYGYTKCF